MSSFMNEFFPDEETIQQKEVIDGIAAIKAIVDLYAQRTGLKHSFPNLRLDSLKTIRSMLLDAEIKEEA